jgi:hypothetical protein
VLALTEGEDTSIPPIPGFDIDTALCALHITRTPFDELNGNIQGFAHVREIAVNPVAGLPHKTTFHHIAHLCCVRGYVVFCPGVLPNCAAARIRRNIIVPSYQREELCAQDQQAQLPRVDTQSVEVYSCAGLGGSLDRRRFP